MQQRLFETEDLAKEFYELASVMLFGEFSPFYHAAQRAQAQKGQACLNKQH